MVEAWWYDQWDGTTPAAWLKKKKGKVQLQLVPESATAQQIQSQLD